MEQESSRIEATTQHKTTEYIVYEHPLLARQIVKRGFCWPALIIGPAYLLYRRLWVLTIAWAILSFIARYLTLQSYQQCDEYRGCSISSWDQTEYEFVIIGISIAIQIGLGFATNSDWEKDLIKRGYLKNKSINARSMDEVLAIIEREKCNGNKNTI
jgi:hypothetical protein